MRHRWSSFTEHSLRYSAAIDDFYIPAAAAIRTQVGKPGAYRFEPGDPETAARAQDLLGKHYQEAWNRYQELLEMGVARELARLVLPVGSYTEFYWSVNARALVNFIGLRSDEQPMWENRQSRAAG